MISYAMLGTNDLAKARAFYDPITQMMGARVIGAFTSDKRVWYSIAKDTPMLVITKPYDDQPASAGNGSMLAFTCASRSQVNEIHAKALSLGAVDEGAPGLRGDQGFYGAYFRDPDGNKLCIYKFGPESV